MSTKTVRTATTKSNHAPGLTAAQTELVRDYTAGLAPCAIASSRGVAVAAVYEALGRAVAAQGLPCTDHGRRGCAHA